MTVELLYCPFCGESSFCRVLPYQFPPDADGPAWKWGYHVVCDASGIEGTRKGCGCSSAWGETEAEAIAAWNRRTSHEGVVVWPDWATDKHIAEGILAEAETILQLVIHGKEGEIALHTGAIKSYAGTLMGREQRRAQYTVPAFSPNKEDEDAA